MSVDPNNLGKDKLGFCIGYHNALQRSGVVLKDVSFWDMTQDYKSRMLSIATQQLHVDNMRRKRKNRSIIVDTPASAGVTR